MVKIALDHRTTNAVAHRLRLTREALGIEQGQFADRLGFERNRYNQYDTGARALTLIPAIKICDEFGVTLDWLFRGDISGLPFGLATRISELAKTKEALLSGQRKAARARRLSGTVLILLTFLAAAPAAHVATAAHTAACCRTCSKGQACGNSCISRKGP